MTRVLSALVLLSVVIGAIWFLPPVATLLLALVAAILAFREYCAIARALGVWVPGGIGGTAVVLAGYAMWLGDRMSDGRATMLAPAGAPSFTPNVSLEPNLAGIVMLSAFLVVAALSVARGQPGPGVLADAAATVFAPVYLGLPLGALAWVRVVSGREAVVLLLCVIVISDSAQYYTGRAFGKRPLAPTISPKKTLEGAIGGMVFGTLAMAVGGAWVFQSPLWLLALLGAAVSLLGIVGDLFESLLKRSAGLKDSSNLIPGHGGVLDRIDSWLFAAPVYYTFVRFLA
ncbi:MAG: phosphatidate cytidylyltransferase [Vicinamibacterales bacterium]